MSGDTGIMTYLIEKGAKIEEKSNYGTPLTWAAANNKINAVKVLLGHKANPDGSVGW